MKITIGYATLLGTIGAIAALLVPMIGELADATEPLGAPSWLWAGISAVLAVVVIVGRYAQAIRASGLLGGDPDGYADLAPQVPTDAQLP